jgi:hypothetical protein
MFKDGRTIVHSEEQSGRPSVVSDDLVQSVDQKIYERRRFKELSCEFLQISCTVLYEIITGQARLGYHKFCATWVPKMLMGAHKTQRMDSVLTLTFLERYHKDGNEFLNHIVRVTDVETWVLFVNVETKKQSNQWMHTHSHNKQAKKKSLNKRLPES